MSITADPLFISAEVGYRRESLSAGLPSARRSRPARRHHGGALALFSRAPRLHHRHVAGRTA
jgi:hypothetical protein